MIPSATGIVTRIYVREQGANIRLDIGSELQPKDNYFLLELTHPNYNALYSLALAAAVNRLPLRIRADGDLPLKGRDCVVSYMVVDWGVSEDVNE